MMKLNKNILVYLMCFFASIVFVICIEVGYLLDLNGRIQLILLVAVSILIGLPMGWIFQRPALMLPIWLWLGVGIGGGLRIQPFYSGDLSWNGFLIIFGIPIALFAILGVVLGGWLRTVIKNRLTSVTKFIISFILLILGVKIHAAFPPRAEQGSALFRDLNYPGLSQAEHASIYERALIFSSSDQPEDPFKHTIIEASSDWSGVARVTFNQFLDGNESWFTRDSSPAPSWDKRRDLINYAASQIGQVEYNWFNLSGINRIKAPFYSFRCDGFVEWVYESIGVNGYTGYFTNEEEDSEFSIFFPAALLGRMSDVALVAPLITVKDLNNNIIPQNGITNEVQLKAEVSDGNTGSGITRVELWEGPPIVGGTPIFEDNTDFDIAHMYVLPAPSEGSKTFCAFDKAGNASQCHFTIDTTPPTLTLGLGDSRKKQKITQTITSSRGSTTQIVYRMGYQVINFNGEDNLSAGLKYSYKVERVSPEPTLINDWTSWGPNWAHIIYSMEYVKGTETYTIAVKTKDEAGNVSDEKSETVTMSCEETDAGVAVPAYSDMPDKPGFGEPVDESEIIADEPEAVYPPPEEIVIKDPVAVLGRGYYDCMAALVNRIKEPFHLISTDSDFEMLSEKEFPILIIPTGGLYGMSGNERLREGLADYVSRGGLIVVMSQHLGEEYDGGV